MASRALYLPCPSRVNRLEALPGIRVRLGHMNGVHYEPIPPTILYQRTTREGQVIVYFVPAEAQGGVLQVPAVWPAPQQRGAAPQEVARPPVR